MEPISAEKVTANLSLIRERMAAAACSSGRELSSIRLVAVTKSVDATTAAVLCRAGCLDLAENRPQALLEKAEALAGIESDIRWHLIGSLQRNKAARVVEIAEMIHSIDSLRLAETVSRLANERGKRQEVLLQVNISHEEAKQGFEADDLPGLIDGLVELPGLRVRGLMGMAALGSDEATARRQFVALRELRDRLAHRFPADHVFAELSMGMSGDFEWAIGEGATIVRIGSLLFE
jgi:PLP dependent protein